MHHPVAGELILDWDTLTASTAVEQRLVIWTAAPETPPASGSVSLPQPLRITPS